MTPRYRPTTRRQRVAIIVATVAVGLVMWLALLFQPGRPERPRPVAPEVPVCAPGQTNGCVGGRTEVIVIPAGPAASPVSPR